MAARIRKGDRVEVIAGSHKGSRGEVLQVFPKENRAVVQGVAVVKRHTKPQSVQQPGGIVEKEAPVHLSNLMLIDPVDNKPTRIGFKISDDRKKVRIAKRSGQALDK